MDAKITEALVTAATAAVGWLVKELRGKAKPEDLKAAAIAAAEAAVKRGVLELERLGVGIASDTLALATQRAIDAIRVAELGPMAHLLDGAQMEQMPPDWHPEEPSPLESDAEPTKP